MTDKPTLIGIDYAVPFSDITVFQSPLCTREAWNFPPSRYRSRRLHKKLVKRFGSQRVVVPAMLETMQGGRRVIIAHPDILELIKEQCARKVETDIAGGLNIKNVPPEPLTPFKLRQARLMCDPPHLEPKG